MLLAFLKFQIINGLYKSFTRMSQTNFKYLMNLVEQNIDKQDIGLRKSITVQKRLSTTLDIFCNRSLEQFAISF